MLKIKKIRDIVLCLAKSCKTQKSDLSKSLRGKSQHFTLAREAKLAKSVTLKYYRTEETNALLQSEMINNGCKIGALPGDSVT